MSIDPSPSPDGSSSLTLREEVERLLNRITPGEWRFVVVQSRRKADASTLVSGDPGTLVGAVAPGHQIRTFGHSGGTYPSSDGAFIAAAPRLVRELLALALSASTRAEEAERHDCSRWRDEGMGCRECNPIARDIAQGAEQSDPRLSAAERQRDELLAALRTYGQHNADCDLEYGTWMVLPNRKVGNTCTCGFSALIAQAEVTEMDDQQQQSKSKTMRVLRQW